MFSRIQDGPIQETGPLAVCEGSARLKMMPCWFRFGRGKLFFKRQALWPCATDQPAWRRHLLFRLNLRLSGRQSEKRGNNFMCSSTIIEHKNESVAKQLCMLFSIRVLSVDWDVVVDNTYYCVFMIFNKQTLFFYNNSLLFIYCMCVWV